MESSRTAIIERQSLQTRLQDLFTSLTRPSTGSSLYTQSFPKEELESLVAYFDNGVDPDPAFSGVLLGRIFLDGKKNLCLASWPIDSEKNRTWRKEVLLSKVTDFSLEFLGEKREADPKIRSVTAQVGWHPRWLKGRKDLPSMVRLNVKQGETALQFAFRLTTSEPIATYWEGPKP